MLGRTTGRWSGATLVLDAGIAREIKAYQNSSKEMVPEWSKSNILFKGASVVSPLCLRG